MTRRLNCVVPYCRRTRGDRKNDPVTEGMEWICADHWKLVGRKLKLDRRRFKRRYGSSEHGWKLDSWIWKRMKAQAIETAMGL